MYYVKLTSQYYLLLVIFTFCIFSTRRISSSLTWDWTHARALGAES